MAQEFTLLGFRCFRDSRDHWRGNSESGRTRQAEASFNRECFLGSIFEAPPGMSAQYSITSPEIGRLPIEERPDANWGDPFSRLTPSLPKIRSAGQIVNRTKINGTTCGFVLGAATAVQSACD